MAYCKNGLVALGLLALSAGSASAVKCPHIMLVLDQSGSMRQNPDGTNNPPSKWSLLQQAVTTILNAYGNQIPFGMELFTSGANDDQQCYADTKITVEPMDGTAMQIAQLIGAAMPSSGTNTGEAIKRARVDPAMMDTSRGDYIILVTDGDPNCNSGEGANATYTVSEIASAAAQNPSIHTFVIGFDGSGGVNPANLNAMAQAGKEPRPGCNGQMGNECYYSASNAQALNDALNMIVNLVSGGGEFGTVMCDDSCYVNGCPMGQICTANGAFPACVPDPCAGVNCTPGQFCRSGTCVSSCGTPCGLGSICRDGNCIPDPCFMKSCMNGQVCNPSTGMCGANPCSGVNCAPSTSCDVTSGKCVGDLCKNITCPAGTACKPGGNCESTSAPSGCSCRVGSRGGGAGACALLSIVGLALLRRRRSR